jgi:hypothetical protein
MCWQLKYGQVHFGEAGVAVFRSGGEGVTAEVLHQKYFYFSVNFQGLKSYYSKPFRRHYTLSFLLSYKVLHCTDLLESTFAFSH